MSAGAALPQAPAAARPPDPASALSLRGLTAAYGEKVALSAVDADFPAGAMTAIIGPNGAGKSTLLKAALGVIPRLAGRAAVFGRPLEAARGRIAYVPQRAGVDWDFPTTVTEVALMGLYRRLGLLGRITGEHRRKAREALARVGLTELADRQIGQLSGGQQQRVFLARALAQEADLCLLDEPFAGVDAATERAVIEVLKTLRAEGRTVVCVHHDLSTVAAYFDHVFMINQRRVAEGPVAGTFDARNLQATYGGRLGEAQMAQLGVAGPAA